MALPFGIILMVLCLVSLIWGLACAVIGGIVRFSLQQYVNAFVADIDAENYNSIADGMVKFSTSFDEADLGNAPRTIGIMAIVVGILVVLYSVVGLAAGFLKNMSLLFVLIGCILVSTMLQFVTIWMIIDVNSSFHDSAKDDLAEKLYKEYRLGEKQPQWSILMNSIMMAGSCCGIKGPEDFSNMTYPYSSGQDQNMLISPACCKEDVWGRGFDALIDCGINKNSQQHKDGCYNTLFDRAYEGDMFMYMILIFLITGWQCIAMAIGVLMLFSPPEEEAKVGPPLGPDGKPIEAVPEAEMKVFTPYSKISSYQHSDINRIKSTEIW